MDVHGIEKLMDDEEMARCEEEGIQILIENRKVLMGKCANLKEENESLQQELKLVHNEIIKEKTESEKLSHKVSSQEKEVKKLKKRLNHRNALFAELKEKLEAAEKRLDNQAKRLTEVEAENVRLKKSSSGDQKSSSDTSIRPRAKRSRLQN